MITANRLAAALYACYRLARRDPGGMAYFDRTPRGVWESFTAAILLLPVAVGLTAINKWEQLQILFLPRILVLELLFYVIGWMLVPVLAVWLVEWLDRESKYLGLVVAYNWISVPATLIWVPFQLLFHAGAIGSGLFNTIGLAWYVLVLVYEGYVFKTALDITVGLAAGLVAAEFMLSLMLFKIGDTMIYGGVVAG